MKILANDLKRPFDLYANEYEQKALEVLRSGWYILGKEVAEFEAEFASWLSKDNPESVEFVGLASGLDALWIAHKLLGISEGDEVIVAANSYIACVMGITIPGGTPAFVEPDVYHNLDANQIESAITPKTKAILAVHLYGQPCDMRAIMQVAKKHNLKVIEDCAQCHGGRTLNEMGEMQTVGTFGDVGCFSFYPTKGLGAFGDGGGVSVKSPEMAAKFKEFRNYGSKVKYQNEVVGANSRLDELQAGLLRVKLNHIDEFNENRNTIAKKYLSEIKNPLVELPKVQDQIYHVWHQFVVQTKHREEFIKHLADNGVGAMIHYPIPPHLSNAYSYLGHRVGQFPITEQLASEVVSLPIYDGMTSDEQDYVIDVINEFEI